MPTYSDLEISLCRRDEASYDIGLRFAQPDSDVEIRLVSQMPSLMLDVQGLRQCHLDNTDYGQALTDQLFGDARFREAFNLARRNAQSMKAPLRVRLFIDSSAIELHSLRWETLRDPDDPDSTLLTSEHYYFSRYLSSSDWQPVRPRAKSELKALVVIANPADVTEYRPGGRPLASIDVAGEVSSW